VKSSRRSRTEPEQTNQAQFAASLSKPLPEKRGISQTYVSQTDACRCFFPRLYPNHGLKNGKPAHKLAAPREHGNGLLSEDDPVLS